MSFDDLEIEKCPICGNNMIDMGDYLECEECKYSEDK